MAELGLNIYQVIQNELITRESSRSTLGLGFRLAILEHKANNAEACARNSRIWRLHHSIAPVSALTPSSRRAARDKERRLLRRQQEGGDKHRAPKDPTKLVRDLEVWEVCEWFPRTLAEFKELQFDAWKVRELMEWYDVPAYGADFRLVEIGGEDGVREVAGNIEVCLEELGMGWGLNWQRIGGLELPGDSDDGSARLSGAGSGSVNGGGRRGSEVVNVNVVGNGVRFAQPVPHYPVHVPQRRVSQPPMPQHHVLQHHPPQHHMPQHPMPQQPVSQHPIPQPPVPQHPMSQQPAPPNPAMQHPEPESPEMRQGVNGFESRRPESSGSESDSDDPEQAWDGRPH